MPRLPVDPPASDEGALVRVENLHKSFGKLEVLRGISLEVYKGEVVVLLGPSGSGKSTLLRCINFLEESQRGSITVGVTTLNAWGSTMRRKLSHRDMPRADAASVWPLGIDWMPPRNTSER